MKVQLTVVILTYNETLHIERAIRNVLSWADKIVVVDSYSQDDTTTKAQLLGADVIQHPFENYKEQREFAIKSVQPVTEWLLFLDADEYITDELKWEIKSVILNKNINGYYLPRRFIFMNKWIKWGGYYPTYLLRLFRPEFATLERSVNEHVKVIGKVGYLNNDFVDHNLHGINYWIEKHNKYASLEAQELQNDNNCLQQKSSLVSLFSNQKERKQWLREHVWNRMPRIIFRPLLYFIYRYCFRLGFLDGKEGFIYHLLQGYWYLLLIDIKHFEIEKNLGSTDPR